MAGVRVYPSDGYLRFKIDVIDLTIDANSFCYDSQGRSLYERYGFDIDLNRDRFKTAAPNYSGAFHIQGAPYPPGYKMTFNPQLIKQNVKSTLLQIENLNQSQPCLFYNKIIPIQETGTSVTRNRAKIGPLLPQEAPNTNLFFPIMNIANFRVLEKIPWQQESSFKNAWTLQISFEEWDLDKPIPPLGNDIN